jgi:hypothetical protein
MRTAAVLAIGGWTAAMGVVAPAPANGAPRPQEEHCVVRVTDQDPRTGELHLTEPTCSATQVQALERVGLDPAAVAADWSIGIHFEGPGFTGSSLTVVGADCTGGWLNTPAGWSNVISSTLHGCPHITHYDGYYLVSPSVTTVSPGGNLGSMDNRTSSLQYFP